LPDSPRSTARCCRRCHSLGGFVGLKLAADHPDQVGRLVIVDSLPALGALQMPSITAAQLKEVGTGMRDSMMKASPEIFEANLKQNTSAMVSKPEDQQRVLAAGLRSDQPTVARAMYEMMTDDMRDNIARIKAPTLVLGTWIAYKNYSTRDAVAGVYHTQYAKLAGVKIEVSDTARHFIMYDDPDWMYARIDDFLK
jgi:pimeloyl-ACP methyl ester carboxylesterase